MSGQFKLQNIERITLYCIFYDKVSRNEQDQILQMIFKAQQIPENQVIILGQLKKLQKIQYIQLTTLYKYGLKLLRLKIKQPNISFKISKYTDSQIIFKDPIKIKQIINPISFLSTDNEICFVYNSNIDRKEDYETEYKLYDLYNYKDNTKTLEQTITGMLNKDDINDNEYSGYIFLGVRDDNRALEGCFAPRNILQSFSKFLNKKLLATSPPCQHLIKLKDYKIVLSDEFQQQFYTIQEQKLIVISIQKPLQKIYYQSSSGVFFQRVQEGIWPMQTCQLYYKYKHNQINKKQLLNGLKAYDDRFHNLVKKRQQNIDEDVLGDEDSD